MLRAGWKILALVLLGSGCGTGPPASEELVRTPPERIPQVTLHPTPTGRQVPGNLVYSSWLAGRTIRREEDSSALGSRPAEKIETAGKEVTIRLHDEVPPSRVNVTAYRDRNSANQPIGKFMSAECPQSAGQAPCSYTAGSVVTIRAVMADDAEIIAVNVGWATSPAQLDADPQLPPEVSAAWAFVLKP